MVWEDLTPAKIQTEAAYRNAIVVAMAMGCSTNAVIHLRRHGAARRPRDIGLDDFDAASREVPVIANIRPSGDKYLMEDFYYAGGLPGLMTPARSRISHLAHQRLRPDARRRARAAPRSTTTTSSAPLDNPIYAEGALAVLRGNLAPDGCVMKPSAATPRLLRHSGPALVFDNYPRAEGGRSIATIST